METNQNAWRSFYSSLQCSNELTIVVQEYVEDNPESSSNLIDYIVKTIDSTLYQDCNNSKNSQQRHLEASSNENLKEFDQS
ncbi:unnamed protein product [Rotaria socialis]|uniref:Uncharacterized protein n=1 Tax=Rotaria socialis TaxID=392032 RepID=A0A820F5I1_9BILA|nr:unnamed protein product [Rotaria socialis]CAF4256200.1 unnamed protein product [Rotaria socialis]CAF4605211.1 unnamed protein product [Rotaria socialis]CAF4643171.1 unnamed protein product [Rotaria socialis]CAF4802447.1 unnamed protein product [Rotaria socialis]